MGGWDQDRLAQVLDNLLADALKYAPEGSMVRVVVEETTLGRTRGPRAAALR